MVSLSVPLKQRKIAKRKEKWLTHNKELSKMKTNNSLVRI